MKSSVRTVTYGGVLAAVVLLATAIPKITIPNVVGYFHLGDGAIFACAVVLGPFAALPAGLGSAMADLLSGYGVYAIPTFLIKGGMGLLAGYAFRKGTRLAFWQQLPLFIGCELIMMGGYFAFESLFYGGFAAAVASLPFNGLQAVAGVVLGLAITPLVRRINIRQVIDG
jgi:uncharacterized membrane protein